MIRRLRSLNRRFRSFSAIALPLFYPSLVYAWGPTGHRVVGEIAETRMGGRARTCVRALLGGESLAISSTWADEIRSEPAYAKVSPWHYVEIVAGKSIGETPPPLEGNSVTAIAAQEKILLDRNAPLEARANALRFIDHFIGDLHQPLHVGDGSDRGGNTCEVVFFGERSSPDPSLSASTEPSPSPSPSRTPGVATAPARAYRRKVNLHWVWDDGLIDRTGLSYSEYAVALDRSLAPADAATYARGDLTAWIDDTASIRESVYPKPRVASPATSPRGPHPYCVNARDANDRLPPDLTLPDLSWEYAHAMQPTLDRQLRKGGVRLAALLDRLFAKVDCAALARTAKRDSSRSAASAGATVPYTY